MRYWIPVCLAASAIIAQPVAAAPGKDAAQPEKSVAKPTPVDPERLALAREIARAFWPDGTIKQMMTSMSGVQSGMMSEMMNKTPKEFGVSEGEDNGKTLGELAREKDPYFEERLKITNRVMGEEVGKVMEAAEPEIREGMAQLYARRFTKAELGDVLAFFRTPSGKAYASQLMPMMSDPEFQKSMTGMATKMMQTMPAIIEKVKKATEHLPPPPKDGEKPKEAAVPTA